VLNVSEVGVKSKSEAKVMARQRINTVTTHWQLPVSCTGGLQIRILVGIIWVCFLFDVITSTVSAASNSTSDQDLLRVSIMNRPDFFSAMHGNMATMANLSDSTDMQVFETYIDT
jgi:hypothetical protein